MLDNGGIESKSEEDAPKLPKEDVEDENLELPANFIFIIIYLVKQYVQIEQNKY